MKKGEIIFSAMCIAFFGFMLFETFELLGQGRPGEVGSGLWPFMALATSTLLSVLMLISSIRRSSAAGPGAQDLTAEAIAEKRRARITVSLSVVCFLVYIIVMPWFGFIIATLLYIFVFALILGERRRWVLAISPVLMTTVIMGVFAKFITIPFPKGIGVFAEFSRLFY
ncbi:MAG: tripartite tricarboxylate transporter TctB family protein [Deltaproteobacteria bacterium]|nr:tripartite tricarboxylate transporter TctB family protein [Deltaproteobacteria bacterium]